MTIVVVVVLVLDCCAAVSKEIPMVKRCNDMAWTDEELGLNHFLSKLLKTRTETAIPVTTMVKSL
jgi:hypothetical protein